MGSSPKAGALAPLALILCRSAPNPGRFLTPRIAHIIARLPKTIVLSYFTMQPSYVDIIHWRGPGPPHAVVIPAMLECAHKYATLALNICNSLYKHIRKNETMNSQSRLTKLPLASRYRGAQSPTIEIIVLVKFWNKLKNTSISVVVSQGLELWWTYFTTNNLLAELPYLAQRVLYIDTRGRNIEQRWASGLQRVG
jgi:hypothetical protein